MTKDNRLTDKQLNTREQIIFHEDYNEKNYAVGGIRGFHDLKLDSINNLLQEELLDPYDAQNYSPMAIDFKNFIENHKNFTAHGYVVSGLRDDTRVTIEGVQGRDCSTQDIIDFATEFRSADDFLLGDRCYCWWD